MSVFFSSECLQLSQDKNTGHKAFQDTLQCTGLAFASAGLAGTAVGAGSAKVAHDEHDNGFHTCPKCIQSPQSSCIQGSWAC